MQRYIKRRTQLSLFHKANTALLSRAQCCPYATILNLCHSMPIPGSSFPFQNNPTGHKQQSKKTNPSHHASFPNLNLKLSYHTYHLPFIPLSLHFGRPHSGPPAHIPQAHVAKQHHTYDKCIIPPTYLYETCSNVRACETRDEDFSFLFSSRCPPVLPALLVYFCHQVRGGVFRGGRVPC